MGTCLQLMFSKPNSTNIVRPSQGKETNRVLSPQIPKQDYPPDQRSLNDLSKSNSLRVDTKSFTNIASTGIGSSEPDRKSSLIFLGNPFETASIMMKNPNERPPTTPDEMNKFYTLIGRVYFIRKTMDKIKVYSPHGESELNCPVNSIVSTFYLTEGLPLESIKEISTGKIIQTSDSPIKITLKLKCKDCDRKVKITYSKSIMAISDISCDNCKNKGQWLLLDFNSNFPIWGDGRKIELEEDFQKQLPSSLRALGCISCLKYNVLEIGSYKEFDCGCLLCSGCQGASQQNSCHLCQE